MISPLCAPPAIPLLPCVSLQLFEETQEVCRNVPPQFAVYTPAGQRAGQHNKAAMPDMESLAALTTCHTAGKISGFSIGELADHFHADLQSKICSLDGKHQYLQDPVNDHSTI